jgi:hypothetical protein
MRWLSRPDRKAKAHQGHGMLADGYAKDVAAIQTN